MYGWVGRCVGTSMVYLDSVSLCVHVKSLSEVWMVDLADVVDLAGVAVGADLAVLTAVGMTSAMLTVRWDLTTGNNDTPRRAPQGQYASHLNIATPRARVRLLLPYLQLPRVVPHLI
jgi:hypothetical protein